MRTHVLVGLAACFYCLLVIDPISRASDCAEKVRIDPTRIIQAVASGVSFLAAGVIVFTQGKLHGPTIGAGLWGHPRHEFL